MAIAIRGTTPGTNGTAASGSFSVVLNSTRQPQAGDLLIIIHQNDFYTSSTMPTPTVDGSTTGVTAITGTGLPAGSGAGDQGNIKAYYWVNNSTGDRTVAVDETGSDDEEKALVVYVLSGADTANPIDNAAGANSGSTSSTTPTAPAVSPTSTDAYLICATNSGGGSNGVSYTAPSGMTESCDFTVASTMSVGGATLQLSASGSTGTKVFTAAGNATDVSISIAVKTASAGGGSVPWTPPRPPQYRDYGEVPWIQKDRRNAVLVGSAVNDLAQPLFQPADARYWHLYNDLALRTSQAYFTQKDRRDANLAAGQPLPSPLDSSWQDGGRYWHLYGDWSDPPTRGQQRAYVSDPSLLSVAAFDPLTVAAGVGGDLWRRYATPDYWDRREVPQQRQLESVPGLLDTAQLENELLGGATTAQRALVPVTHDDRRLVPQQRTYFADIDITTMVGTGALGAWFGLDDTAHFLYNLRRPNDLGVMAAATPHDPVLAGYLPGLLNDLRAATHVDRREVPQQRLYISDPSFYPTVAPTDPLTVAWGVGGHYWLIYNQSAMYVDRREVPQQRQLESEPGLLSTAQLENELLGGADDLRRRYLRAAHYDRRLTVGYQPARLDLAADIPADPLLVGAGVGGDRWRRYAIPGTHYSRRLVPQQRPYARDPSLDVIIVVFNATSTDAVAAVYTSTPGVAGTYTSTPGVSSRGSSTPAVSDG